MLLCAVLFGSIFFLTPDTDAWKNLAYGQNDDIVEGYLDIFHGHLEDRTPLYEFHLLDFDTFSRPAIIIYPSNNLSIKELVELTGKKVRVKGNIFETSFDPPFKRMQAVSIKPVGATVELDKNTYTWTDKVYITIVAPHFNLDPTVRDEIGDSSGPIKISTRGHKLDNYILVENYFDSGIFTGEVTLTGFLHDADGNVSTGDSHGNDSSPKTLGSGPTGGFIEAEGTNNPAEAFEDNISVSFEFSMDETVVRSATIKWNIGQVQWLDSSYPKVGPAVIRITDPDMNLNPEANDSFKVDVWSDSDADGIDLTVTETTQASGIFEGTVIFTGGHSESSSNKLEVAVGDDVTAEYADNTLPDPYTTADERYITSSVMVKATILAPIIITNYEETDNSYETYRLLYDLFHDESKIVFTSHNEPGVTVGSGVPSKFISHIIPLKFRDLQEEPHTTEYFLNKFYRSSDSVSSYWHANSYGNFNLEGDISDWKTLPRPRAHYFDSNGSLLPFTLRSHAMELIYGEIDFDGNDDRLQNHEKMNLQRAGDNGDDVDQLILIINDQVNPDQARSPTLVASSYYHPHRIQTSNGELWVYLAIFIDKGFGSPLGEESQKGYGAAAHELGHNFNLYHTPMYAPHKIHSDPWSLLSGKNDDFSPAGVVSQQKRKLHWIGEEDVVKVLPGQSNLVKLDYLYKESPSSDRYLMAEVPFVYDGKFYTVEARKDSQFDHIPAPVGLMIYKFYPEGHADDIMDTDENDKNAPLSVVEATPACLRSGVDGPCIDPPDYSNLALKLGQTYSDSDNNIQIQLVSQSEDSMSVCISNNSDLQVPKILVKHTNTERGQNMILDIEFKYCFSEQPIIGVTYDLVVSQNDHPLLQVYDRDDNDGVVNHRTTPLPMTASLFDPVDIQVTFHSRDGPSQIPVTENVQVVPEFETVTIIVLSISIITVIALTSRSKLSLANHISIVK